MAKWNTSRIPLLKHKENNNISTCNFISGEMVKKSCPNLPPKPASRSLKSEPYCAPVIYKVKFEEHFD